MNSDIEVWKDVTGYEQRYQVSNKGRVKGPSGKILKPFLFKGYPRVSPYNNGSLKCASIHRLVASHFVENQGGGDKVNHKNFDRLDNRAENLEWVTTAQNTTHSKIHDRLKKKLTRYDVICIRKANSCGVLQKEIAQTFGVSRVTINRVVRNLTWNHV